jgi:hypothetical protein
VVDLSSLGSAPAGAAANAAPAFFFPAYFRGAAVRKTAALAFVAAALTACSRAQIPPDRWAIGPQAAAVRCVNQSSGAAWDIAFDKAHGLADGQPATFGPQKITWGRRDRGVAYELDRASGVLVANRGSSTGGWVSTFTCAASGPA